MLHVFQSICTHCLQMFECFFCHKVACWLCGCPSVWPFEPWLNFAPSSNLTPTLETAAAASKPLSISHAAVIATPCQSESERWKDSPLHPESPEFEINFGEHSPHVRILLLLLFDSKCEEGEEEIEPPRILFSRRGSCLQEGRGKNHTKHSDHTAVPD